MPKRFIVNVGGTRAVAELLEREAPTLSQCMWENLPVESLQTMEQQVANNTAEDRMISILSAAFAGLATLLAGIGLYGGKPAVFLTVILSPLAM